MSSGSTPESAGSGSRPVQFAQPQKIAVLELKTPAQAPITRGLTCVDANPAIAIESIMVIQFQLSTVAKTRPRNSSETCRNCCVTFKTLLTATAARDKPMKDTAAPNVFAWLNNTYD